MNLSLTARLRLMALFVTLAFLGLAAFAMRLLMRMLGMSH